jgi:hypothetical protein
VAQIDPEPGIFKPENFSGQKTILKVERKKGRQRLNSAVNVF